MQFAHDFIGLVYYRVFHWKILIKSPLNFYLCIKVFFYSFNIIFVVPLPIFSKNKIKIKPSKNDHWKKVETVNTLHELWSVIVIGIGKLKENNKMYYWVGATSSDYAGTPPQPRSGHSAVNIGKSKVVVFGGLVDKKFLSDILVYDIGW